MPEGLAQTMTESELVDLIAYLATLRQPAAIVGQYHLIGPFLETGDARRIDPASAVDLDVSIDDGRGRKLSWRRTSANAEGLIDLTDLAAGDANRGASVYAYTPVLSPGPQQARLILDTSADVAAWLGGKPVTLARHGQAQDEPRSALVDLPPGPTTLVIRLALDRRLGAKPALVTTIVADQPVGFTSAVISH
jgi:hypothetical protein